MRTYELTPERTALLVIDMTNDFLEEGSIAEIPAGRAIVPQIRKLTEAAREASIPVIYFTVAWKSDGADVVGMADRWSVFLDDAGRPLTCIAGTHGIEIYEALAPQPGDLIIEKPRSSGFAGTPLADVLSECGVDTLVITGVAANGCCESTARDAVDRDYRVVYVSDATATRDLPDAGWGPITAEETTRVLLTEMAFAMGEVASTDALCRRFAAISGTATT